MRSLRGGLRETALRWMRCPSCLHEETRVLSTRTRDSGIVARRHSCQDCGHRFTTYELPPEAVTNMRYDITRWEKRRAELEQTRVPIERMIKKMCEARSKGETCNDISARFGQSVHMTYYYTRPKMMTKYGFAKTPKRPTSKIASPWSGLMPASAMR